VLNQLAAEGFGTVSIDVTDDDSVTTARDTLLELLPDLDTVITMSGIGVAEDLRDPAHFIDAARMVDVNLLGTIRVIDAFSPHLLRQGAPAAVAVGCCWATNARRRAVR